MNKKKMARKAPLPDVPESMRPKQRSLTAQQRQILLTLWQHQGRIRAIDIPGIARFPNGQAQLNGDVLRALTSLHALGLVVFQQMAHGARQQGTVFLLTGNGKQYVQKYLLGGKSVRKGSSIKIPLMRAAGSPRVHVPPVVGANLEVAGQQLVIDSVYKLRNAHATGAPAWFISAHRPKGRGVVYSFSVWPDGGISNGVSNGVVPKEQLRKPGYGEYPGVLSTDAFSKAVQKYPIPHSDYEVGWNRAISAYSEIGRTAISPSMADKQDANNYREFLRGWNAALQGLHREANKSDAMGESNDASGGYMTPSGYQPKEKKSRAQEIVRALSPEARSSLGKFRGTGGLIYDTFSPAQRMRMLRPFRELEQTGLARIIPLATNHPKVTRDRIELTRLGLTILAPKFYGRPETVERISSKE